MDATPSRHHRNDLLRGGAISPTKHGSSEVPEPFSGGTAPTGSDPPRRSDERPTEPCDEDRHGICESATYWNSFQSSSDDTKRISIESDDLPAVTDAGRRSRPRATGARRCCRA